MKKIIFILSVTATLMAGIIFSGYRLSAQKQKAAQAKVLYAKQNLNPDEKAATVQEWIKFKSESELKIRKVEIRIAELKIKNQGEIFDTHYKKKIPYLEEQIKYMKARLEAFEKGPSNWESFKQGFNREMDAIGEALNDLRVDN